jgi:ATP/maltotriose-dependent transcriptional regulator MalT
LQHVVLLVAPAGYGKSVAVRQYLEGSGETFVRYDVGAEHASLLGFVRGFADALREIAPDVRQTVSGAYEKSRASRTPGADLAMWMHAHIKTFGGLIAIDDLHVTENDPEVTKFLAALVERTKGRARWLIASRSSLDLPVASWLAYGEMDLTIDEEDLKFTFDEARHAARASLVGVRDDELSEILTMTDGWPTALGFALRTSIRSVDLRNIAATTREMIYRYLAEQVYKALTAEEREFLHFAANLPEIDLEVVRAAGYEKGKALVEALRDRVSFIYADRPGVYRCHDLFRDFLQHQLELEGDAAVRALNARAARALEATGRLAAALGLYAKGRSGAEALPILERDGFALMEQAHGDVVVAAIEALPQDVRAKNSIVLGLRALGEVDVGRLDRAESLFERAISKTTEPARIAALAIRYALVLVNQGKNPAPLLAPLLESGALDSSTVGEMSAILAGAYAFLGPQSEVDACVKRAEAALVTIDADDVRAKILQRLGFAFSYMGELDLARGCEERAAELAIELGLFSLAGRAYSILMNVASSEVDAPRELWYAQQTVTLATKSGDRSTLQVALLQMLEFETRRANWERVDAIGKQLSAVTTTDALRSAAFVEANAMNSAAHGRFDEAYRALLPVLDRVHFARDRFLNMSLAALSAVATGERAEGLRLVAATVPLLDDHGGTTRASLLVVEISRALCAVAEALAGRATVAAKILSRRAASNLAIGQCVHELAHSVLRALKAPEACEDLRAHVETLQSLGYGCVGRIVEAAFEKLNPLAAGSAPAILTPSELAILRGLADGKSPKELAIETDRSVFTIQTHIQNAIAKLGCSGRNEALVAARKNGLLAGGPVQ